MHDSLEQIDDITHSTNVLKNISDEYLNDEWWMMNDEWWMMNDEWWIMNDEW